MSVDHNKNGWATETLMKKWANRIWNEVQLENQDKKVKLLVMDKCSSHTKEDVLKEVKKSGYVDFIPAGCTSLAQPLDLVINKPFKDHLRSLFDDWLKNYGITDANKSAKGYLKAPSTKQILTWIHEAWAKIDSDLIIKAFKHSGS